AWDSHATNTVVFYTNGIVTLQFTNVSGWDAPSGTNVSLVLGQLTIVSVQYRPVASLSLAPNFLGITGASGVNFVLEYRTSLMSGVWLPLKTNTIGPGFNPLLDWPPTNGPAAFYRARLLP